MRTTNRLLDPARVCLVVVLGAAAPLALVLAAASCSNTSVTIGVVDEADGDAAVEAEAPQVDAGVDTSAGDGGVVVPTSDAGPPPIVCAGQPCAKALVNTHGAGGFCALLDDGTVACWGENMSGQLGRGPESLSNSATPERVPGLSNVVHLENTCAVDADGSTWCWGQGPFLRSTASAYTTESAPVKLEIPPARRVAAHFGMLHSVGCALLEDGDVACWGMNANGQVRPPVIGEDGMAPNDVTIVPMPAGAPIARIFVGTASFVLRSDGTLSSWGANPPLGRVSSLSPDPTPKPIELTGVTYADVAEGNACAVARGSAYCWGTTLPVQGGPLTNALPRRVDVPEAVVSVATTKGRYGSAYGDPQRGCATGLSGDVYCWGANGSGQAGDGTRQYALRPVKVKGLPAPASVVRTAPLATCALLTNGKVYCWGENGYGELGNGYIQDPSLAPVEVLLP